MRHWEVSDPVFQSCFLIAVGGTRRDAFDLLCRKLGQDPEKEDGRPKPGDRSRVATVFFETGINNFIMWFRDPPPATPTADYVATIAHEAMHGTVHIMNTVRMGEIADANEEAYTYYLGYVTREVFRRLWPVKKEKKR